MHIEYLDEKGFKDFMQKSIHIQKGILQTFIDPVEEKNSNRKWWYIEIKTFLAVIQAVWKKEVCLLSKRVNNKRLCDNEASLYEKCVTYEGNAQMSESSMN